MTDLRKAAEMALEALEISNEVMMSVDGANDCSKGIMAAEDAIESIRTALAQPESIKPSDLLIDTYSVNLGAWSVNNRGVKITHVPTGTVVCSDSERSQHANKRVAMQKLEAALAQPEQRENRMTDREAIQKALDTPHRRYSIEPHGNGYAIYRDRDLFHHGFNLGHLTEVTPETIELIENALNTTLAYPEQEPTLTEKDGSPCPEFWDWLPKAYNFEGLGEFTKYNMEVAFLAGKNTALAQPEQEPVHFLANGVRYKVTHQGYYGCSIVGLPENLNGQWVALVEATDSKHLNCIAHQESTKPEQQPVAYLCENAVGHKYFRWKKPTSHYKPIPLYTEPTKREWQELTDEDWHNLPTSNKQGCERDAEIFDWIEDKLKEKNT